MSITIKDFQLTNQWKLDVNGKKYGNCCTKHSETPRFIIDETTQRKYLNEPKMAIRFKCCLLTLAGPFIHSISSIINVAVKVLKLASFSHFWMNRNENLPYGLQERFNKAGKDILRIAFTPLAVVGLEFAAVYGVCNPYDGRKLYATIERALYGEEHPLYCKFFLNAFFQPEPIA